MSECLKKCILVGFDFRAVGNESVGQPNPQESSLAAKAEVDEVRTSTMAKLQMGNDQAKIGCLKGQLRLQSEFATGPDHPANQTVSATFPLLFSHFTSVSANCWSRPIGLIEASTTVI
jgi:hypothetical protein